MERVEEFAYAKLNLTLDVLGRRPDGYHDMKMVMVSATLTDRLALEPGGEGIRVSTNLSFLPNDRHNLAAQAVLRFAEATGRQPGGMDITIQKSIPVCAGMAGGSADAAAALRAMNTLTGAGLSLEELAAIGAKVGSDVPYCVYGTAMLAEGRGEVLTPLPALPHCWLAICKPGFSVSTPELFHKLDSVRLRRRPDTAGVLSALEAGDLTGAARRLYNVFEDVLPARHARTVDNVKNAMIQAGALGACMTGTGSAVFGIFDDRAKAAAAVAALGRDYPETFLAESR